MKKRQALRGSLALVLALAASPLLLWQAGAHAQGGAFKNLQVLPKTTDKATLKKIMKAQAKALGVECEFCHKEPNMEEDTDHKKAAREMMRMTDEVNKKWFEKSKQKVSCMTCHRGKEKPEEAPPAAK